MATLVGYRFYSLFLACPKDKGTVQAIDGSVDFAMGDHSLDSVPMVAR